ncbi:hypothetical protein B0H66DRAFT_530986 [Apodospora peruviana]|uniref:Uncharacterized protein n=1 Tax=Apodospora peruviana TaxID=516989 RepID=A0AAE0IAY1_9PEZI|nr:hypothetical protein B0H66DRAFT_530986 [Apodospora peruviana]
MAQPSSSFNSNNPFRRKPLSASSTPQPSFTSPVSVPGAYSPAAASVAASSASSGSGTVPALPSGDQFRSQLQALARPAQPAPATSFQKAKIVKRVRVQSPPPSSPESAGAPDRFPPAERDDNVEDDDDESTSSSDDDGEVRDPFGNIPVRSLTNREETRTEQAPASLHRPPPNPFQKTLEDLELASKETREVPSGAPGASGLRGTLDVDAFRRLLLTGQAGGPGPLQAAAASSDPSPAQSGSHPVTPGGDGASITDASSVSRQSIFDAAFQTQDTPRTSHEISEAEPEGDQHGTAGSARSNMPPPPTARRKPPPPSSRHGKLIKVELKGKEVIATQDAARPSSSSGRTDLAASPSFPAASLQPQSPTTPSDVNKPLPPAPLGSPPDGGVESIFDREAAGKVPELDGEPETMVVPLPRPPTAPNLSHATPSAGVTTPKPSKKPAPPPRRQPHGRSDSRQSVTTLTSATPLQAEDTEPSVRRPSLDSIRSRSSSLRVSVHAPTPPPPRRSTHMPARPSSSSITSPSNVSFSSIATTGSERSPSDAVEFSPLPGNQQAPLYGVASSETGRISSVTTPAAAGSSSTVVERDHLSTGAPHHHHHSKLSPPPPPPARNASVRSKRPPSVSSLDATSRRMPLATTHSSSMGPPPPPPPSRQRGGSKGSMDGSSGGGGGTAAASTVVVPKRTSVDSVRILEQTLAEEPGGLADDPAPTAALEAATAANDILADLTALQREVDALRGRYEKGG